MTIGETVLHYKILKKLGEGGMGIVYLAEDTKLKRNVAIKFLPHAISANKEERQRFEIEAQAAASLNHPNIATIHAIEEADDEVFIVMEYIEGRELKDIIKPSSSPLSERGNIGTLQTDIAIKIAIQIVEGLEAAHKKGIIHRDIKSSNIMITEDNNVKIMDFGLAKIRGGADITQYGSTVGTIAYMSPEQARGKEVDQRTDIWSFGVVFYEMLTGKQPFKGAYEQAVLYSILNEEPESLMIQRTDMPVAISNIIDRLLKKDPDQRYSSMKEVLKDLNNIFEKTDKLVKKAHSSIAVLAFKDMSPQKDQDYFCEGLAEELINALTKIKTLRVTARTSAFAFKGKQLDIREIGSKLNVETILEGSIQKSANRLRISAQLINVDNGYHIWSERYDRELSDIFEIQDEITDSVVRSLELVLTAKEKKSIESIPAPNVEAFEYYLRGRRLYHQQIGNYEESIKMFMRAIEIDSGYALAYCGLSDCYSWRYMYRESSEVNLLEAEKASSKAIELGPNLAEAHTSYGLAISLRKKYDEAEREFEKAINLNPRLFEAYYFYARLYYAMGNLVKAANLFEKAITVRPEDYQVPGILMGIYRSLNDQIKYIATVKRLVQKCEQHLKFNPDDARAYYMGGGGLLLLGEMEKGEEWFARAISLGSDNVGTNYNIACAYVQIGKIDEALSYLARAIENGFSHREWFENDPDLDPIKGDSRFQDLLKKMK